MPTSPTIRSALLIRWDFRQCAPGCGGCTIDGCGSNLSGGGAPGDWCPGCLSFGPGQLLSQQNGWYASCVSYNFNCDANGNYVPPDGAYVITVPCSGTFSQIDCAAPSQAVAGSQGISIYTSLGMQYGLGLLAQYQADPMSSSGKDILQQLSQMSSSAQAFIILGYGGSVSGSGAGAVIGDLAQGPADSLLFGTRFQGNAAFLNSSDYFRVGFSQVGQDQFVFRIGGTLLEDLRVQQPPHKSLAAVMVVLNRLREFETLEDTIQPNPNPGFETEIISEITDLAGALPTGTAELRISRVPGHPESRRTVL